MSKYNNLSDGKSDGFILLYVKDGLVKPISLNEEQASLLDIALMIPFKKTHAYVHQKQNVNIIEGVIK